MSKKSPLKKGTAFLLTMIVITVVSTVAMSVGRLMVSDLNMTTKLEESIVAYYAAEAGIEDGLWRIRDDKDIQIPVSPDTQPARITVDSTNGEKKYDLTINYKGDSIQDVELNKDDVFEISKWGSSALLTLTYHVYNYAVNPTPGARFDYGLEIIKLLNTNISDREFFDDNCTSRLTALLSSSCDSITGATGKIYTITIPVQGVTKIKIKPWGYFDQRHQNNPDLNYADPLHPNFHIRFSITPDSGQIEQNYSTIRSTGYFGKTKRTLEAKVDRSSGQVISLFDFTIFQGGQT